MFGRAVSVFSIQMAIRYILSVEWRGNMIWFSEVMFGLYPRGAWTNRDFSWCGVLVLVFSSLKCHLNVNPLHISLTAASTNGSTAKSIIWIQITVMF
jgi:hypothetical protein